MADDDRTDALPYAGPGPFDPATQVELEAGLRFVHIMEAQGRSEQTQLAIDTSALIDLLIAKGIISARELDERRDIARQQQAERDSRRVYHTIATPPEDPADLPSPDVPCGELLPICRAACCTLLFFSLSVDEVTQGLVRWEYGQPYRVRRDPRTGRCCHFNADHGCTVYEHRPIACRAYSCANDGRIWKDFEARIPADIIADLPPLEPVG